MRMELLVLCRDICTLALAESSDTALLLGSLCSLVPPEIPERSQKRGNVQFLFPQVCWRCLCRPLVLGCGVEVDGGRSGGSDGICAVAPSSSSVLSPLSSLTRGWGDFASLSRSLECSFLLWEIPHPSSQPGDPPWHWGCSMGSPFPGGSTGSSRSLEQHQIPSGGALCAQTRAGLGLSLKLLSLSSVGLQDSSVIAGN